MSLYNHKKPCDEKENYCPEQIKLQVLCMANYFHYKPKYLFNVFITFFLLAISGKVIASDLMN